MTTLLSVLGILLSIAAVVLIVQLQSRVDSLEQRCAHYESVFAVLQRKLGTTEQRPPPPLMVEVDLNNNSPPIGGENLPPKPLGEDFDEMSSTISPLEDFVRRLSSSLPQADDDNLTDSSISNSRFSSLLSAALRSTAGININNNSNANNKRTSLLNILPEEQDQFDQFVHEVS